MGVRPLDFKGIRQFHWRRTRCRLIEQSDFTSIEAMEQQNSPTGSWAQLVGAISGVAVIASIFWVSIRRRRLAKAARRERPPQQIKLLRPPGHSLMCRIDSVHDRFMDLLLQTVASGALLGLGFTGLYPLLEGLLTGHFTMYQMLAASGSWILVPMVALVLLFATLAIRGLRTMTDLATEIESCRLGLRGEQAVAEALADCELAAAGYIAFHDVPGSAAWNIDHVVVGPGGVFVLETKARSRRQATRNQQEHVVVFNGQTLQFPWCEDRDAAKQVERNAAWVRDYVKDFAIAEVPVQSVVVVPGWWVELAGKFPVKVMNALYLKSYLIGVERRFRPEDLKGILRWLDERCRDIEF